MNHAALFFSSAAFSFGIALERGWFKGGTLPVWLWVGMGLFQAAFGVAYLYAHA